MMLKTELIARSEIRAYYNFVLSNYTFRSSFLFSLTILLLLNPSSKAFADILRCDVNASKNSEHSSLRGNSCYEPSGVASLIPTSISETNIRVNLEEDDSIFSKTVEILNFLVALGNVAFVIYLYRVARDDRHNDRLLQTKSFWFQQLVLQPNRDKILKFFSDVEDILDQYPSNSRVAAGQTKAMCRSFNGKKADLSNTLVAEISVVDSTLGAKLDLALDEFQDRFTTNITTIPLAISIDEMKRDVRQTKVKFLGEIYIQYSNS